MKNHYLLSVFVLLSIILAVSIPALGEEGGTNSSAAITSNAAPESRTEAAADQPAPPVKAKKPVKTKSYVRITMDYSGWGDWFGINFKDWASHDMSAYKRVEFYLKNISGANLETLKCALGDSEKVRNPVDISKYATIGKRWTKVSIPFSAFDGLKTDQLSSFILEREPNEKVEFGLDEVKFVGDEDDFVFWGDDNFHKVLKSMGGTDVDFVIEEKGGK